MLNHYSLCLLVALDQRISSSTFFHGFLRLAQNETHMCSDDHKNVNIAIILPGDEEVSVPVTPTQETSSVIRVYLFCLHSLNLKT